MKIHISGFFHFAGLLSIGTTIALSQNVLINEIMYHPASENLNESYVELYNPGPGATNLSGFQFTKGFQFVFLTNSVLA